MAERYTQATLKEYKGKMYETYPLTWVVKQINSSVPSVKRWEYDGLVPETLFGKHRFYTKNQIELLGQLSKMLAEFRCKPSQLRKKKEQMIGYIQRNWRK